MSYLSFSENSAAAFPIIAANRVLGMIELFGETPAGIDGSVADLLCAISTLVGQYHQKVLAEEALHSIE